MKKLFNNPWFVMSLSALALGYFVLTVLLPLFVDSADEIDSDYMEYFDDMDSSEITENSLSGSIANRVDREKIGWLYQPTRDPFSQQTSLFTPTIGAAMTSEYYSRSDSANQGNDVAALPILSALFHKSSQSMVVLNGDLVGVGDIVSGFNVKSIGRLNVVVEHMGRRYTIEPTRNR